MKKYSENNFFAVPFCEKHHKERDKKMNLRSRIKQIERRIQYVESVKMDRIRESDELLDKFLESEKRVNRYKFAIESDKMILKDLIFRNYLETGE